MSELISKEEITNYIPQRSPIIMIDTIESCEVKCIETTFEILPDNIFVSNGEMSESGLLENIAQSAAAKVGYECHKKKIPVPLGFIGAINKIEVSNHPKVGEKINTFIEIQREVFGVTIVKGMSKVDDIVLISCEMKIVIASEN